MHSLFSLQDCFLTKKKWLKVTRDVTAEAAGGNPFAADRILMGDMYLYNMARVPTILRCGVMIREAVGHGMPVDPVQVAYLLQHGPRLREDFLHWFEEFQPLFGKPVETESQDPISPYK